MFARYRQIIKLLRSPEFVQELRIKLVDQGNHFPELQGFRRQAPRKCQDPEYGGEFGDEELYGPWPQHEYLEIENLGSNKDFYKYQKDTFLTGGAVAGLLWEKIHGKSVKINDIDFFFYDFEDKNEEEIDNAIYSNLNGEDYDYKIQKTREEGLFNFIEIIPGQDFTWRGLLKSFDLNYAQVGLILAEDRLIYTKEFVQWLATGLLEVTDSMDRDQQYPLTTLLRARAKCEEYGNQFYFADAFRRYWWKWSQRPRFRWRRRIAKKIVHSRSLVENKDREEVVTKKRLKYWRQHPEALAPWATLRGNVVVYNLPGEAWINFLIELAKEKRWTKPASDLFEMVRTLPPTITKQPAVFFQRLRAVVDANLLMESRAWGNLLAGQPEKVKLFKQDLPKQELASVAKFLSEHLRVKLWVKWLIFEGNYTLPEVLTAVLTLRQQSLFVIGQIEATDWRKLGGEANEEDIVEQRLALLDEGSTEWQKALIRAKSSLIKKDVEEFFKQTQGLAELQKTLNQLVIPLSIKPFSQYVRELTSREDLEEEGRWMRHCVGGYVNKVKAGQSRIFHVEINGEASTVELTPCVRNITFRANRRKAKDETLAQKIRQKRQDARQVLVYQVNQHRSRLNKDPTSLNNQVVQRLLRYLNQVQEVYQIPGFSKSRVILKDDVA